MADVTLKVVGCGDAFGSGGRLNTCFYIKTAELGLLMDCGASSLPGLKREGISTNDIDAILISHFHGDHYAGVPFVLLDAAIHGRKKKILVVTPPGGRERITALLDLLYPGTEVLGRLDVHFLEYTSGYPLDASIFLLQGYPMVHSEAALSHGLRLQVAGKIISYSGDTSWTDNLIPLSRGADLFICECNFFDREVQGHLSYKTLQTKISSFGCKKLLLTHFDVEMLDRLSEVAVDCAHDGMELSI